VEAIIDGKVVDAGAGDIVVIKPDMPHRFTARTAPRRSSELANDELALGADFRSGDVWRQCLEAVS